MVVNMAWATVVCSADAKVAALHEGSGNYLYASHQPHWLAELKCSTKLTAPSSCRLSSGKWHYLCIVYPLVAKPRRLNSATPKTRTTTSTSTAAAAAA